jgi:hypothetical protein
MLVAAVLTDCGASPSLKPRSSICYHGQCCHVTSRTSYRPPTARVLPHIPRALMSNASASILDFFHLSRPLAVHWKKISVDTSPRAPSCKEATTELPHWDIGDTLMTTDGITRSHIIHGLRTTTNRKFLGNSRLIIITRRLRSALHC